MCKGEYVCQQAHLDVHLSEGTNTMVYTSILNKNMFSIRLTS